MLTGKQFRITRQTVGLQIVDGVSRIVTVPADGIIKVISDPSPAGTPHQKGTVYASWEGQTIALFAVDVEARGVEIPQALNGTKPNMSATA